MAQLGPVPVPRGSAHERIQADAVSGVIRLQRYGFGLSKKMLAALEAALRDAKAQLRLLPADVGARRTRLEDVIRSLEAQAGPLSEQIAVAALGDLDRLAVVEAEIVRRSLERAVGPAANRQLLLVGQTWTAPSQALLAGLVRQAPVAGTFVEPFIRDWAPAMVRRATASLRTGMLLGESVQQLARRVDSMGSFRKRGAEALARTVASGVSAVAREATYRSNADLIRGIQIVATLDDRTTPICRSLDGEVYPVGEGPRPPFHVNCRTTTAPVLRDWQELGLDLAGLPEGERWSRLGPRSRPAAITHDQWLRSLDAKQLASILGQRRARLYRDNESLSVRDIVDRQRNRYLSIEEIEAVLRPAAPPPAPAPAPVDLARQFLERKYGEAVDQAVLVQEIQQSLVQLKQQMRELQREAALRPEARAELARLSAEYNALTGRLLDLPTADDIERVLQRSKQLLEEVEAGGIRASFARTRVFLEQSENPYDSGVRSNAKASIQQRLSARLRRSHPEWDIDDEELGQLVSRTVQRWAQTSGNGDEAAVALQMIAREMFDAGMGLEVGHMGSTLQGAERILGHRQFVQVGLGKAGGADVKARQYVEWFLRAQYEETQEALRSWGITELYLVRGVRYEADEGWSPIQLQPMSSFSTEVSIAASFGKTLHLVRVDAADVIGSARSGFGCLNEWEIVVLGRKGGLPFVRGYTTHASRLGYNTFDRSGLDDGWGALLERLEALGGGAQW